MLYFPPGKHYYVIMSSHWEFAAHFFHRQSRYPSKSVFVFLRNERSRAAFYARHVALMFRDHTQGPRCQFCSLTMASMEQKLLLFAITTALSPPTWNTNRWIEQVHAPSQGVCWRHSGKYGKSLPECTKRARVGFVKVNYNTSKKKKKLLEWMNSASWTDDM